MWHADVAHYIGLSRSGYLHAPFDLTNERSQQFAFFPLHPLLLWLLGHVTDDVILWGAALSNVLFLLALVFLHKLTLAFGYDESVARRAVFYLAAFPASYFFSIPMTESLFVVLTVGSFYAAKREQWWTAGVLGMLASATRLTGVMLLPSLLVLSWQMYRSLQIRKVLGLLLAPFGLFAYSFYAWWLSGDALAFKHAEAAWGREPSIFFLGALFKWLIDPRVFAQPWNVQVFSVAATLLCFFCIYVLVRRREWALALYTSLSIVLPLSSGVLQSLERYTMGFFPMFIALGIAAKSEPCDQTIRFVFVFLLGIMTALYAAAYTNALA
jgi:Gpi18-like mannosyltransferase